MTTALEQHAKAYRHKLIDRMLPYRLNTVDERSGGLLPSDDAAKGRSLPKEKQVASQARMVWAFSNVHVHGRGHDDECLKAAE